MISFLQGKIIDQSEHSITLLCGEVGYEIFLSTKKLLLLKPSSKIQLYIYTKVREDDISLFGFETKQELQFFKLLLTVNGIGPKIALEIMNQDQTILLKAIKENNLTTLNKIPGIGKKTAERIILELKSKIPDLPETSNKSHLPNTEDAISALLNLGYTRNHIDKILSNLPQTHSTTEQIITYFLQNT